MTQPNLMNQDQSSAKLGASCLAQLRVEVRQRGAMWYRPEWSVRATDIRPVEFAGFQIWLVLTD